MGHRIGKAVLLGWVSLSLAHAQNAPSTAPSKKPKPKGDENESPGLVVGTEKPAQRNRRKPGEKEAEGTQAPNRFKADTVLRSQYELEGRSLEVDPD